MTTQIRHQVQWTDSGTIGTGKLRGGTVASVQAASITVRMILDPNHVGFRTFSRSLAPQAIVNDPIAVQISGTGAFDCVVVEAYPTRAAGPNDFGLIPDSISGQQPFTPWWAGMLHERSPRAGW